MHDGSGSPDKCATLATDGGHLPAARGYGHGDTDAETGSVDYVTNPSREMLRQALQRASERMQSS